GLGARDPAVLDADRVGCQREAHRGDARERRCGPAVGGEAITGWRQVPEKTERAVLERVEERRGVGRNARAPGVVAACSEGQGENNGCEPAAPCDQKLYSAPSCARRGSLTTQVDLP